MYCTAAPRIPRPSDEQFINYAKEGKTEQVAEALRRYPDLVYVQDCVSDLFYCDEGCFPSLCDCLLCISPLDARFITTQSSPRLQLWYNFLERYPSQRCDCLLPTVIFWLLVCSRYLDLYLHLIFPLHFLDRYHQSLLKWYAIFIIS